MKLEELNQRFFNSIYRGYVVWNDDPAGKGRLKIFVPGVYSNEYYEEDKTKFLPWATPAMPSFGGNAPSNNPQALNEETGWCSAPHAGNIKTGAQVWVFFEQGDINYPVYFAFAQSGDGWLAEHPNQHVLKTDNVTVKIDENVKHDKSKCKFSSYTLNNSDLAKEQLKQDCEKFSWDYDDSGIVKDLGTRVDIEVKAEGLNAINLNILGNVNMHIKGDWFIEHFGNRYEYHEGETFIKHNGNTYIEQNGNLKTKLIGYKDEEHRGDHILNHTGNSTETHDGDYFNTINGAVTLIYNSEYKLEIGKNYTENIKGSKKSSVSESSIMTIIGDLIKIVTGSITSSCGKRFDFSTDESISFVSNKGNITLETKGDFEIMNQDGIITETGFNNIGTKGNIQLISTFGNINLQCKKDDTKADFNQKSIVVPWNPGFLAELDKHSIEFPGFNKNEAIFSFEKMVNTISAKSEFTIDDFTTFFTSLNNLFIYDGLPVFLPTKMIVQNPSIPAPNNTEDYSWIPQFRSESSNWKNISSNSYWKIPGRLMGNINIETWSGDINIKTKSELGCAGNINIEATESAGTLPGYKIGCITMKNNGKKRIYPDPRDLFLDSDFNAKLGGTLTLFSHGTNFDDLTFRRTVLPPATSSLLKSLLGVSALWKATNYKDFYKLYGTYVVTRGTLGELSSYDLKRLENLQDRTPPTLGCIKCITDYLIGLPGIQELCYTNDNFSNFGTAGIHSYGFSKFNPFDKTNARGTFNILTLNYDKISMGDGHAIEMGFINKEFVGRNIGHFGINSSGSFTQVTGRNYYFYCNTDHKKGIKSTSYTYTEDWIDDVPPQIVNAIFNNFTKANKTISKFIPGSDDFQAITYPLQIGSFITSGYKVREKTTLGEKIKKTFEEGISSTITINVGKAEFILGKGFDPLLNMSFDKLTFDIKEYEYIKNEIDNEKNHDIKTEIINKSLNVSIIPNLSVDYDIKKVYKYDFKLENNVNNFSGLYHFNLKYDSEEFKIQPYFYSWNIVDNKETIQGNGYKESSTYDSHKEINTKILGTFEIKNSYTNYIENKKISVTSPNFEDEDVYTVSAFKNIDDYGLRGEPNNIILNKTVNGGKDIKEEIFFNTGRSNYKYISYSAPINSNILKLTSKDGYKEDGDVYAMNNIQVELNGQTINIEPDEKKNIITENSILINQNGFKSNVITLNNNTLSDNALSKGSKNYIFVSNGCNTINGENIIKFDNGLESSKSRNIYSIENGNITTEKLVSGQVEENEINLANCPNSNHNRKYPSYTLHTHRYSEGDEMKIESVISEYADYGKLCSGEHITINCKEHILNTIESQINAVTNIKLRSSNFEQLWLEKLPLPELFRLIKAEIKESIDSLKEKYMKIFNKFFID